MATTSHNPMRTVLLVLLLVIAAGVVVDTLRFTSQGEVTALRTKAVDTDAASVDAFCGFAPCGMPLECN